MGVVVGGGGRWVNGSGGGGSREMDPVWVVLCLVPFSRVTGGETKREGLCMCSSGETNATVATNSIL